MVKDNYKPPTVHVPDEAAEVAGLAVAWGSCNTFAVFASSHDKTHPIDIRKKCPNFTSQVTIMRQDTLLFDPLLRKLINESCSIFVTSPQLSKQTMIDSSQFSNLLKLSRKYRSVLRECIENIQEDTSRNISDEENQRFSNCIALLYNLEFIWHLTEVLYIDAIPDDVALPHISNWIRFHFPESERNARNILQTIKSGGSTIDQTVEFLNEGVENIFADYWDTVIGLVIQGNVDLSRILLQLHSQADTEAFTTLDKILRTMPVYKVYGELSLSEFIMQWKLWQGNAGKKLSSGLYEKYPQLTFILQLISGNISQCLEKLKLHCGKWYQAMAAVLLYKEPAVKFHELSYHAHQFIKHYGGNSSLNLCDATVLALFENDLNSAVKKFQMASDGGWLATHLTHLLTLCGKIESDDSQSSEDLERGDHLQLHVKFILEYGTLLMCHKSLWQVGLCYLDQCSHEGRARQHVLLSRISPRTDAKTMKIIQAASSRGLNDVATGLCRVQGMKCMRRNQLGKALEWAFRSQDSAFASHLADQFLQSYVKKGSFDSNDFLDNLGSCMLICDRLTFLGKYCEFRRLYSADKLKEAATCLNDLITSKIAPKYFWLTLLTDALPLLQNESEEPLFDTQQTANLTFCLNELSSLSEWDLSNVTPPRAAIERQISIIRLALAKNMAKALCTQMIANPGF
ncbi:nuclear pore complex protein Nup85 [Planococcus citri]|uniref:nuclear pore complex protein Nup85 n=1 Tax=Planococcus citri TaxID=170843 RepID=UPI0031F8C436